MDGEGRNGSEGSLDGQDRDEGERDSPTAAKSEEDSGLAASVTNSDGGVGSDELSSESNDNPDSTGDLRDVQAQRPRKRARGNRVHASAEGMEGSGNGSDPRSSAGHSDKRGSPTESDESNNPPSRQSADDHSDSVYSGDHKSSRDSGASGSESDSLGNRSWVYHYRCPAKVALGDMGAQARLRPRSKLNKESAEDEQSPPLGASKSASGTWAEGEQRLSEPIIAGRKGDSSTGTGSGSGSGSANQEDSSTDSASHSGSASGMRRGSKQHGKVSIAAPDGAEDGAEDMEREEKVFADLIRFIANDDHAALSQQIEKIRDQGPMIQLEFTAKVPVPDDQVETYFLARASILQFALICGSPACAKVIVMAWPHTLNQGCNLCGPTKNVRVEDPAELMMAFSKVLQPHHTTQHSEMEGSADKQSDHSAFFADLARRLGSLVKVAVARRDESSENDLSEYNTKFQKEATRLGTLAAPTSFFRGGYVQCRVDFFRTLPCSTGINVEFVTVETRLHAETCQQGHGSLGLAKANSDRFDFMVVG